MENLASSYWNQRTPLKEQLLNEAYNFEFFQAVRLLELLYFNGKIDAELRKRPFKITGENEEHQELFNQELKKILSQESYQLFGGPVQFKSNINPSFPASDLESISFPRKEGNPFEMLVNFMGLAGISGPLPAVYTQMITDNERANPGNTFFRAFLDMFNNHLVYLMYKVRKKSRIGFDMRDPADTNVAGYLFSLNGMGSEGLRNRLSINDNELLYYTGLLANHNRSIAGVEFILSDYLNVKVACQPLQGNWQEISSYHLTYLGKKGQNQILGDSVVLGSSVWDQSAKFNIRIGPINEKQYINFLPLHNSISFRPLYELTRQYVGADLNFEAVLIVDTTDLNGIKLNDPVNSRLGWTSWLPLRKESIHDYEKLFFIEAKSNIKIELEHGKRLKLGWTVWVPDTTGKIKYIEIRLNSSVIERYI